MVIISESFDFSVIEKNSCFHQMIIEYYLERDRQQKFFIIKLNSCSDLHVQFELHVREDQQQ